MSAALPGAPRPDLPEPPTDDRDLRAALRALPPAVDARHLRALEQRVLAQWGEQVAPAARAAEGRTRVFGVGSALLGGASGPDSGFGRLRWLALALTIVGVIGAGLWLQRPDPVLDELMRVDVLSQMAAGEM